MKLTYTQRMMPVFWASALGVLSALCSSSVEPATGVEQRADKTNKDVDSETGRFRSVGYRSMKYKLF